MTDFPFTSITSVTDVPASGSATIFASRWTRLGARLLAGSLDHQLASGRHPATSHLLATRAQQLIAGRFRRELADTWLDLLVEARRPRSLFDPAIPLLRSGVTEAESQIRSLADALVEPLPTVRGVAMAVDMLRDGAGPLFNRDCRQTLVGAVSEVIALLNPLSTSTAR